ncbi:MAG: cysteine hydrolase [Coriobacteriales bacterium]|jgi:nicotinamidase-related amidase|nr:cysteine hydrolase [Coriobacteriales bacterium]
MKKRPMIIAMIAIPAVIVIACVAAVVITVVTLNTPTKGEQITKYSNPRAALIVLDMQNDTTSNSAYKNTNQLLDNVNDAITRAQLNGIDVIYVKNEYEDNPIISILSGGRYQKGTLGVELDSNLLVINDNIYCKSIGDSFQSSGMEEYLITNQIDTLYIVGADASACVYSTAQGGLNRGYNVIVIQDAIITINDETLDRMLKQYATDGIEIIKLADFTRTTS